MKAAILDGVVVDIHPENGYECHPSITWVDCDDKVKHGWTYDGKTFKTDEPTFTADDELKKLQSERNTLLQQSDWTQTVDCPLSDTKRAEWATYRQQLRDFMLTYNESTINSWEDYDAIVWPTKPE